MGACSIFSALWGTYSVRIDMSLQSLPIDLHRTAPHAAACCKKFRDLQVDLTLLTSRTASGHLHVNTHIRDTAAQGSL
jgi:hypothetical protein